MPSSGAWHPCSCACGEFTARTYAPGHDARSRGMLLRYWRFQPRIGDRLGLFATSEITRRAAEIGGLTSTEMSQEAERILSLRGWLPNQHGSSQLNRAARRSVPRPRRTDAISSGTPESELRAPEVQSATDMDWSWIDQIQMTDRNFGVEMEFYGATAADVIMQASILGLNVQWADYTHAVTAHWKIVTDGSVHPGHSDGFELVSPILNGYEGLRQLAAASRALALAGARVNRTCGVHVHLDASDLQPADIGRTVSNYVRAQPAIDRLMPASRRTTAYNRYCNPISEWQRARISEATTQGELANALTGRYYKVNIQSLLRHGTVEFRQHAGSIDGRKIAHWISLLQSLVDQSKQGIELGTIRTVADLLDATATSQSTRAYLTARDANLNGTPVVEQVA